MNRYLVPASGMDSEINSHTKFEIKSTFNVFAVDKIIVETNDMEKRIKRFIEHKFTWGICSIFVHRDFIIENKNRIYKYIGC